MTDFKVDLHIHTTYSDGKLTPTEIITKARSLGYEMLAITDHDNADGLKEARRAAADKGLRLISGIEIAVNTDNKIGLHMLGYGFDENSKVMKEFLAELINAREVRNLQLIEAIRSLGYDISIEEIKAGDSGFIGKPLIARLLVSKGYIKNELEAFGEKVFMSEECLTVKKVKPSADEAISVIRSAGGLPVLAHPIQIERIGETGSEEFYANVDDIIGKLKSHGLEGLECYHPDQDEEQSQRFMAMAKKHNLFATRGSDFHGDDYGRAKKTAGYANEEIRKAMKICYSAEQGRQ